MSRKKPEFALNVGTSSILFIFVILCLVSFAILSLASAVSDEKLTNRVVDNAENYYAACNNAEELLDSFDDFLQGVYAEGISRAGFFETVGKKKSFAVEVTDIQTLKIEIRILYPEKAGDPFYEITSWKVETTKDLDYDENLHVFKEK